MKRRFLSLLVCGLIVAGLTLPARITATSPADQPAIFEIIDVGQGDSILIRSPEGKTALIDAGPSNGVASSLKAMGLTSIDLLVISHHHSDHYGGMMEVIREFHPKYFLATNSSHTTPMYLKLLKLVEQDNIQTFQALAKPRRVELGSLVLTVFPQPPMSPEEENDNSIGIRVTHGSISFLLTGDSEETERNWWMAHNPELLRNATILKLAHHGSRNGTDERWLDLIQPELTVASLGQGNSYGHPHSETVNLLSRKQIPFKRTDRDGSVRITSDGRNWRLSTDQLATRTHDSKTRSSTTRRR